MRTILDVIVVVRARVQRSVSVRALAMSTMRCVHTTRLVSVVRVFVRRVTVRVPIVLRRPSVMFGPLPLRHDRVPPHMRTRDLNSALTFEPGLSVALLLPLPRFRLLSPLLLLGLALLLPLRGVVLVVVMALRPMPMPMAMAGSEHDHHVGRHRVVSDS